MEIIKCHIENFGKFSNFDYDFKPRLNIIKEENGYGKTTFADFIKAMFYGMETKKNTKQLLDRKKYEPWQGGKFGGNIEFKVNGKTYKLERFFEKKEADDTFKLYDLSTNLETADFSQNIGEEIFKLNKEAFERSTYISGTSLETAMNDSISAKLGNILENENDVNSSEKAIKYLDDEIKNYKKTGGRGLINEKILERTKLEKKLEQSKIDNKALEDRKHQNKEITKQIEIQKELQEKLTTELSNKLKEDAIKEKQKQYEFLKRNYEESKNAYENFRQNIIKTDDVYSKIEVNKELLNKIDEKMFIIEKDIKKYQKINKIYLLILLIMTIIMGAVLVIKNFKLAIFVIFAIIVLACFYIISKNNLNKRKQNLEKQEQEKKNVNNLIETLEQLKENQEKAKQEEFKRLEDEYNLKLKFIEKYEKENNIQEILNFKENNTYTKEYLEEEIKNINTKINKLNDEKNYNKNQIEILESNLNEVFEVENELEDLNNQIEEMTNKLDILEKTKNLLAEAKEQFSSKYLNKMQDSFIKNTEYILKKNIDTSVDVNLNVKINEKGSNKDLKYFSTGYKDLIYICMRLSLIDSLFEGEKPFIILDDPFANLDEQKLENAIDLIKTKSEEYQIIYFVCHESRI